MNKKYPKSRNPDWWGRFFALIGILLASASLFFQFFNYRHSFSANIRNVSLMPDTTYFEVININDGDFNELIKGGGFIFITSKSDSKHIEPMPLIENIEIEKGTRKMVKLKYQTYSERNIWELRLSKNDTYNIDIHFF